MALTRASRRALALAVALTALAAALAAYGPTVFASSSTTLSPAADGYVDSGAANRTSAGSAELRIDGSPVVRTYLRFDLRSLSGTVTSAKLKLFAESPSGIGYKVSRTDGTSWSESSITWSSKPALGSVIGNSSTFSANTWTQVDVTSAVTTGGFADFAVDGRNGTAIKFASDDSGSAHAPQLVVTVGGGATAGPSTSPTARPTSGPTVVPSATPTQPTTGGFEIIAAGDNRTDLNGIQATAKLILARPGDPVLDVGDDTVNGSTALYNSYFNPTWGQFKSRIWPVPGNHEYETSGAAGYFAYYGSRAGTPGQGWYSFNLPNNWHVIALNSNVNHAAGSPQELFLKSDLAANAGKHIIAMWHSPRFSSGSVHGSNTSLTPFWNALYAAHADLVFDGDDHDYERFGLQNPSGKADPNGIREFVVATGGAPHYAFGSPIANSQSRIANTWGITVLTLNAHSYSWKFIPIAGLTATDSGTQATHS